MSLFETIAKDLKPSPPIFNVSEGNNRVRFILNRTEDSASTDPIVSLVRASKVEKFDIHKFAVKINITETVHNARHALARFCSDFTYTHSSSPNPKLTSLYQWANAYFSIHTFNRYPELESDLINIYKYVVLATKGSEEAKNGIKLFEFIKQKYEKKGLVYEQSTRKRTRRRRY